MYSKKQLIAAAPLVLSLAAFTQEALAVTDITTCQTISESGSFRLTRNLSANGDCLVVTADRVEIDLRGHTIGGDGTGTGVTDQRRRGGFAITLRDGTIANFQQGVNLGQTEGSVVEQLRVVESGDVGITLFSGRVRSNVVFDVDGSAGIQVGTGVVADNFVSEVGTTGIVVGSGSTVIGNSVSVAGRDGVSARCPARVADNSVRGFDANKTDGFTGVAIATSGSGCSVSDNASNFIK
ncbi:MAG: hypothetical protein ACREXS_17485 [Gammaproteobacteria bacterium]